MESYKKIRFFYIPQAAFTASLPYIVKPSALSGDSDQPILDLEDLLECGATADTLRYKRQYAKAKDFDVQFEGIISMNANSVGDPAYVDIFHRNFTTRKR